MTEKTTTPKLVDPQSIERAARALDAAGRCLWDGPFWAPEHFDDRRTPKERLASYRNDLRRQARSALAAAALATAVEHPYITGGQLDALKARLVDPAWQRETPAAQVEGILHALDLRVGP